MNQAQPALKSSPTPYPVHELHLSKDAEEWFRTLSPGLFASYSDIEHTWNSTPVQFSLTLMGDAEWKAAVLEIKNSHKGATLVSYEALLMLLLFIFRAWRLAKSPTWLTRIWTQFWIGTLHLFLALLLVPWLIGGDAYRVVLLQTSRAVIRHFLS